MKLKGADVWWLKMGDGKKTSGRIDKTICALRKRLKTLAHD
jgi:hypothetical protein